MVTANVVKHAFPGSSMSIKKHTTPALPSAKERSNSAGLRKSNCTTHATSGQGTEQPHETLAAALLDRANFTGLVLGCIEAKFYK